MKAPKGLLTFDGKIGKGEVVLTAGDGTVLKEYGGQVEGTTTSCYVLTSPEDLIKLKVVMNPGVAHFADLVIDGVLRNTVYNSAFDAAKPTPFRKTIEKAFYQERVNNRVRAATYCTMKVKARNTSKGM